MSLASNRPQVREADGLYSVGPDGVRITDSGRFAFEFLFDVLELAIPVLPVSLKLPALCGVLQLEE